MLSIARFTDLPLALASLGATPTLIGLLVVCLLLVGVVVALVVMEAEARKRRLRVARDLVGALEGVRSGQAGAPVELEAGSELAVVADAVARLGQDVSAREQAPPKKEEATATTTAAREIAVIATDMDGDIREFSRGAAKLLGHDEEYVVGRPMAVLFDEASYRDFLPKMARREVREAGVSARATMLRNDRTPLEVDLTVRALAGGGFAMILRDATEQSRLERDLRESETRYRGLIEALADGVAIVQAGTIVYANPAFCKLCGRDERILRDERFRDLVSTADVLAVAAATREAERESVGARLNVRLVDVEGRPGPEVGLEVCPISHAGRAAAIVLARDDTRERRLAVALQRNEARLDAVLEASPDGIVVLAETGVGSIVQMTNRAFLEAFDLRQEDVLGREEAALVASLTAAGRGAERVAGVLGRRERGVRNETVTVEGREVAVSVLPLVDASGGPIGRLVACRDRTEARRTEADLEEFAERVQLGKAELELAYRRLEEMHREVEERADRTHELNVELRRLNQMKSELLSNVSHELQTPLVSIRGYTEMILKGRLGPVSDEQRRGLSTALTNIDRLIGMIDGLLAFSRSETELGRLHLSRFDLRALVSEALELLQPKIAARKIKIDDGVEADLEIHGDREKVFRVLVNVLANAVKFNRPGGQVGIVARRGAGDRASVSIEDTGAGISRQAQERIFERNYRGEPGDAPLQEGSGIGLAIVRDVLRLHGCRIYVESEEGTGSTFTFELPLAQQEVTTDVGVAPTTDVEGVGDAGS